MVETISRQKKQSRLFGFLIGLGIFLAVIAILAVIKVTPYGVYKGGGISIKYPAAWKLVDHPDNAPGAIVGFASPAQTAMDTFSENVNITFQDLAKPMSLEQFSQLAMRQLTGTFKGEVRVLETESMELAGRPGFRFSYMSTMKEAPLQMTHVWTLVGNRAYIFTYSAMEDDYETFSGEVNFMLKSFRIL